MHVQADTGIVYDNPENEYEETGNGRTVIRAAGEALRLPAMIP